ncbi:hypothetical protein FIBSPDRAFT_871811, partial [Athelia psychrophila]
MCLEGMSSSEVRLVKWFRVRTTRTGLNGYIPPACTNKYTFITVSTRRTNATPPVIHLTHRDLLYSAYTLNGAC